MEEVANDGDTKVIDSEEAGMEEGDNDDSDDDSTKVFVSRLPRKWNDEALAAHFSACFGPVKKASVRMDRDSNSSRCFGFVVFETVDSQQRALEQKSMHVSKRTVMIRPVERTDPNAASEPRDTGICFAWTEFRCTRGDECRFKHEGSGACMKQALAGEGKAAKCLEWRKKGACRKGDACPFRHEPSSNGLDAAPPKARPTRGELVSDGEKKGVCNTFKSKGKCRKGDSCLYSHLSKKDLAERRQTIVDASQASGSSSSDSTTKRRRIDGMALIHAKAKFLKSQPPGEVAAEEAGSLED
jgi:hypothetical protein